MFNIHLTASSNAGPITNTIYSIKPAGLDFKNGLLNSAQLSHSNNNKRLSLWMRSGQIWLAPFHLVRLWH